MEISFSSICASSDVNGVLYEQVLAVKFFSYQGLAFAVVVAFVVALHRVCIRTLMSRMMSGLGAGWGSRGESMLPFIGRPRKTKTPTQSSERGVDATGEPYAACW